MILLLRLLLFAPLVLGLNQFHEFQRYDGWYNNLAQADWGSVGSRLHRKVPSSYSDGVYLLHDDRPSARAVSDLVFKGPDGIPNKRNITTMLAYFSQVVAYEVLQSSEPSCPLEMHKIQVPKGDPIFDSEHKGDVMMPFTRAKYDKSTGGGFNSPREQINEKTSWIDASFLYSTQEPWVAAMRAYKDGKLKEGDMSDYPPFNSERIPLINPPPPQVHRLMDPERLFLLGDPRVNENPGLLGFGLMLYRWHNRQAERLQRLHPDWTDNDLFHAARRCVIATLQNIVMYEFLPALLDEEDPLGPYRGYQPELPPGISHLFAAGAFRFPHTLVPSGMYLRRSGGDQCSFHNDIAGFPALRLCQNWWNAQDIIIEYTVEDVILGMASQLAENEDSVIVSDLRDFLFGPMHFSRLDLAALGIMRGRDNGLPDYNTARAHFNLPPADNWSSINPELHKEKPEMFHMLSLLYNDSISDLDLYVGGMLESRGKGPGDLFSAIIKEQFQRIRDADRFWFENTQMNMFNDEEIAEIRNLTLYEIIRQTTNIGAVEIQKNVFYWRDGDPCPQPQQLSSEPLQKCIPFMRYDHFMGNDVVYIFTCIALGIIPVACAGVGFWMIRKRQKGFGGSLLLGHFPLNNEKLSVRNALSNIFSGEKSGSKRWKAHAVEWLHEHYCRSVRVLVDEDGIRVESERGALLRELQLDSLLVFTSRQVSSGSPFVLLKFPKDYDLVLRLESPSSLDNFLKELEKVICSNGRTLAIRVVTSNARLLLAAETKEKRQRKLEYFFREAYAKAFNVMSMQDRNVTFSDVPESVLATTLTRSEFADALGMREEDVFVERMFGCVAKSNRDKISFCEFLSTVRKFSRGSVQEKLQIIYEMCDYRDEGSVDRHEFLDFFLAIKSEAGVQLDQANQMENLRDLLRKSGIPDSQRYLTRKDFESLLVEVTGNDRPVGLHFRGRKETVALDENESLNSFAIPHHQDPGSSHFHSPLLSWLEDYRQHISCLFIFFAFTILFFLERYWHYSQEVEHRDLRRVLGVGIAWTRGAAAAMSFCFGILLLTVCRNLITHLRETPLNNFIPFDSAITFHKIIAITCGFFTVIHTVGHCINFYHVATQSQAGLRCLFQEAVFSSDFQPSISYWFFGTVTGITGLLLVVVMSIIYVFAAPSVINSVYHAFRLTHLLNILLYALTIAHGLPKLLDKPRFWYFILIPAMLFVMDRIVSLRQDYRKLDVIKAVLLPSDIYFVQCKRPRNFLFRSGQWVRVSCPALSCHFNERHAFSIASSPQDSTIEFYIKAVGPWTFQLRNLLQQSISNSFKFPVLNIDGPYGGGAQNWYNYRVAVFIGGGIGVTPYASVLKDLVQAKAGKMHSDVACDRVYFVWVCSSHKNFEFFVDVLREVEAMDTAKVLEIHIFVTQFFHKFDLRTTMLYICEKHFRCQHGKSMFTNLKAVNHFGRPNFPLLFRFIQQKHAAEKEVGVFSCGPGSLNASIREAVNIANRSRDKLHFVHRYETF